MPELPEAEVILTQLRAHILKSRIREIQIGRVDIIREGISSLSWYEDADISDVSRQGKCVVLTCSKKQEHRFLLAELGMTGLFLFQPSHIGYTHHLHMTLHLARSRHPFLHYWNPRRFGRVYLLDKPQLDHFIQRRFGADPLRMTQAEFCTLLGDSRGRVKPLFLNQHKIAGVGNIYANEILYRAEVHPHARGNQLSKTTLKRLYTTTQTVLQEAIAWGGSTVRDFRAPDGSPGQFQDHHTVYNKTAQPCPRGCPDIIRRMGTDRRSFYCRRCQKCR